MPLVAIVGFALVGCLPAASAQTPSSNSLTVDRLGLRMSYPDGWSVASQQVMNIVTLVNADGTAQVSIYGEPRTSPGDAVTALADVASESATPATRLTIGGWPALERRELVRRSQPSKGRPPTEPMMLKLTTAVAAGTRLVRVDAALPSNADRALIDQVEAMGRSLVFTSTPSGPAQPR